MALAKPTKRRFFQGFGKYQLFCALVLSFRKAIIMIGES